MPIDDLVPWVDNPRNNSEAVPEVAASIKRFGFASPIIARKADNMVIAGHTRLEAARSLGLDRVPVRHMDLDPADSRLLALSDNKVGEIADWDNDKLAEVLRELDADGHLDGLEGLGFDESELDSLLGNSSTLVGDVFEDQGGEGAQELSAEDFESFEHECPRCGFGFN
jgi:site-specific DNA-methyltransferase (adenine-specific)